MVRQVLLRLEIATGWDMDPEWQKPVIPALPLIPYAARPEHGRPPGTLVGANRAAQERSS